MANVLKTKTRAMILNLLGEGNSMRASSRLTGVSINTVSKLLVSAGEACAKYHDENVRGVKAERVQCDEIWSFVGAKQKNVPNMKDQRGHAGDVWTWTAIDAEPDEKHINTSYVECMNLNVRMRNRRFTRLTNALSKKVDNHLHMLSLHFCHYNFCRIHKSLRVTPAMEVGVSNIDHDMEWIVGLIDANAPVPKKRGPYKKKEISN